MCPIFHFRRKHQPSCQCPFNNPEKGNYTNYKLDELTVEELEASAVECHNWPTDMALAMRKFEIGGAHNIHYAFDLCKFWVWSDHRQAKCLLVTIYRTTTNLIWDPYDQHLADQCANEIEF